VRITGGAEWSRGTPAGLRVRGPVLAWPTTEEPAPEPDRPRPADQITSM